MPDWAAWTTGRGSISSRGLVPSFDLKRVQQLTREIDAYQKKIDEVNKANETTAADKAASAMSQRAGEIVRQYDAAGEAIKAVENQIVELERALKDSAVTGKMDSGTAQAEKTVAALRGSVGLLKKDYAEGGAAAAAALRQAKFQQETAGLNSYQRGLREITERFKEMREAAIKVANVDALPNIRDAERASIADYNIRSGERAKAQVVIPQDYVNQVMYTESRGNDNAKNPLSSATGAGQFIDKTWLTLFKKTFTDLAAGMSDAAILAKRSEREYTVKMIEALAQENAVSLARAGHAATSRNLHLAHFLGDGGAIKALNADPSANAASVLGASAAKANPTIVGGGRSIADVLAYAEKRAAGNNAVSRSLKDATVAEQQNTEAIGKSVVEATRLAAINDYLNADRQAGGELGQKYATAEALPAAKSDQLTASLRAQREEILANAEARAKAAGTGLSTRFDLDLKEQYAALGRTPDEQRINQQARQYSAPGSADWDKTIDGLTRLHEVTSLKDSAGSFLKGMTSDLINGTKASEALANQLKKLASTLADKAINSLLSGLFDSLDLGKAFSTTKLQLADGGYTGGLQTTSMEVLR